VSANKECTTYGVRQAVPDETEFNQAAADSIRDELWPEEHILWAAKPAGSLTSPAAGLWSLALVVLVGAAMMLAEPRLHGFGIAMLVFGLGSVPLELRAATRLRQTAYAITDRRVLIVEPGWPRVVHMCFGMDINRLLVRAWRPDGGRLMFAFFTEKTDDPDGGSSGSAEFIGIKNVDQVGHLMRTLQARSVLGPDDGRRLVVVRRRANGHATLSFWHRAGCANQITDHRILSRPADVEAVLAQLRARPAISVRSSPVAAVGSPRSER
jgi:hypothetical protein